MIIIIEGPDGAGKTTQALRLSSQLRLPIRHRSRPKDEKEKARMMAEYKNAISSGRSEIWDRAWYSEMVYGPIMRDASVISHEQMYELEDSLPEGSYILYCTGAPVELWERSQIRGEKYITSFDDFCAIHQAYEELMLQTIHTVQVKLHV